MKCQKEKGNPQDVAHQSSTVEERGRRKKTQTHTAENRTMAVRLTVVRRQALAKEYRHPTVKGMSSGNSMYTLLVPVNNIALLI